MSQYPNPSHQPYGQHGQPAPGQYPQPGQHGQYGQPYGMYQPAPQGPESTTMGTVGLLMVIAGTVGLAIVGWLLGQVIADMMVEYINRGVDPSRIDSDELARRMAAESVGLTVGMGLASLVGFAGWVLSIVAAVMRKGRVMGIWGIVLGIIGPVIAGVIMMVPFITLAARVP